MMNKHIKYLAILCCIVGLGFFLYKHRYIDESNSDIISTRMTILTVAKGLDLYLQDFGYYPSKHDGLIVLTKPGKNKSYYIDKLKNDAWNQPLVYKNENNANSFLLYSIGKNGIDENGQGDDVN